MRAVSIVLEPRTERYSASTSPNRRARSAEALTVCPCDDDARAGCAAENFSRRDASTRASVAVASARRRRVASSRSVFDAFDAAAWLS